MDLKKLESMSTLPKKKLNLKRVLNGKKLSSQDLYRFIQMKQFVKSQFQKGEK